MLLNYTIWVTIFCLIINFMIGKLRLLSLIWLYNSQRKHFLAKGEPNIGLSVIICARNDLKNLEQNLHTVLTQDYPDFEVIVVNDASEDDTFNYLLKLSKENARVKMVDIQNKTSAGKKYALQQGIKKAQYPFVVLTDADCAPVSDQWLKQYAPYAADQKTVVLGYGKYQKQKGFLNMLIRFDTTFIAIRYMSKALWRHPYMGVGRNMGYSKDLLPVHDSIGTQLASGDDDLFVQAVSQKSGFIVLLEKESFTVSHPKKSWAAWFNQKGRHTTTAPRYSFITQLGIMFQWLVSLVFYVGIICILLTGNLQTGITLFALNLLCLGLFNGLWISKLGEKDLILSAPFLDFIYTFVQPIFVLKSWGRKKDRWN